MSLLWKQESSALVYNSEKKQWSAKNAKDANKTKHN
jgi:hypothetical protein